MNRTQQILLLYAELRRSISGVAAGDLLRIAALVREAFEEEDDLAEFDAPSRRAYAYAQPVDQAMEDGGWAILFHDRRSLINLWYDESDPADKTTFRLRNLIGKIEWPRISEMG